MPVLRFAHQLVRERVKKGDYVIDATLGNGHDTLMLAQLVGEQGIVMAFDVQEQAFLKSRELLQQYNALGPVVFVHDSHANMQQHWNISAPKVIMFNLGYLPGADKQYTTQVESTLTALKQSLELLDKQGLLVAVIYPGHPEGRQEDIAVSQWASQLNQREFQVLRYDFINQINSPPYLLAIEKLI
ncbi:16S rRNA (cytosine(1402)-N(4))-methyltransferase [Pelistega europaea]|uniref:16S rRNA (Cytosine(1402)-N(4))-methyltransferase n=2 Tax=Pelistega europaea TaxID=106147 RepID=A0A7Y4L9F8_9BURK|nr:16S rRNA (cytosine(1402)-N(4))-methyltransferase [Pelistega europaea]